MEPKDVLEPIKCFRRPRNAANLMQFSTVWWYTLLQCVVSWGFVEIWSRKWRKRTAETGKNYLCFDFFSEIETF